MYEDLEKREMEILFYIKRFIDSNGYPPSIREICNGCNIKSTSTVHSNLEKLELKNYIRRGATINRAIEVIRQDDDFLSAKKKTTDIPILGRVAAGLPILASENISDTVPMATDFVKDRNLFFLTVQGESMIDAGILDGDQVLIEPASSAEEGEIILALIEDEATIKTFYRDEENQRFRLQPENSTMEPIYVDDLKVLGRVIGLYRLF
ncbi:transcriptional repressor LexA [Aedoeadaptatus acetigenes]|uniref:transcriptional repressor LexA n=1 Tax=Aedoeadaptatus acetigenes TaxID=2981723 RepID=UPI0011DCCA5F|nr:transcriptional repressor LexA [Aedoeadaptatus acetigenes]MCU6786992.1 transcriptional repressor LexA [Aedoeadaptatus acetigenes]